MNNLLISYDLYSPGQDYKPLISHIFHLGKATRFQLSNWYVSSQYTALQAANHLITVMDTNDTLLVVDATNNCGAYYNIPAEKIAFIKKEWNPVPLKHPALAALGRMENHPYGTEALASRQ